ncbi:MAG: carbohydrate ABC transporter permease [Clostridia bacterium]|nr:carbohydrate ABC transporter permease [Clostridia bacterium]MBQ6859605.1 carbohydrate ABC transporter permease [Clostridia bacterium]MBQ7051501.1 carbohydrate ABC transporter permease [Clostridia bacterium]MBQ9951285.1 carbohydrate ABC transporter permease [Clostridia bacterium]
MSKRTEPKSYSKALAAEKTVIYIVCIALCVLSIFPFAVMFVNATRDNYSIQQGMSLIPGDMLLTNWQTLNERQNFDILQGMWNSMFIATCSTVLALYFSTLAAYGLVVYRFKGRQLAFTFIMVVLMIPTQVSAVGFFTFMYKLNLVNTFIPLIIPAIASPSLVFFMRQYMIAGLPLEIVEAARIDGSSEFATYNTICLPLMKPALATQAIFCFVGSWNRLFEPTMLINSQDKYTMPMLVSLLKSDRFRTDYGTVYLALALTVLPLFIVYFALSKYIIAGVALGGVKE